MQKVINFARNLYKMNHSSTYSCREQDTIPKQTADTLRNIAGGSLQTSNRIISKTYNIEKRVIPNRPIDTLLYTTPKPLNTIFSDYKTSNIQGTQEFVCVDKNQGHLKTDIKTTFNVTSKDIYISNIIPQKGRFDTNILFIFLVSCLILLAIVVKFYGKYINQIFEATIYKFSAQRLVGSKTAPIKRFYNILDLLFYISVGILVFLILDRVLQVILYQDVIKTLSGIIAVIIALRLIRIIANRIILISTGYREFIAALNLNTLIFTRTGSIILTPLVFLGYYLPTKVGLPVIFFCITMLSIILIMRTIRTARLFLDYGFSIFYFILYLCALEIIPILLIYKLVYIF